MTNKTTETTAQQVTVNQAAKNTIIEALRKNAQADLVDFMNDLRHYQKVIKNAQGHVDVISKRIAERSAELEAEIAAFEASV